LCIRSETWPSISRRPATCLSLCSHPSGRRANANGADDWRTAQRSGLRIAKGGVMPRVNGVGESTDFQADKFLGNSALAHTATPSVRVPRRQEARRPATEHDFRPEDQDGFPVNGTRLGFRQRLIASTAIVAAVGVGTVAYFWASAGEKTPTQAVEVVPVAQSSTEAPVQTATAFPAAQSSPEVPVQMASTIPEPSTEPPTAVASPDPPASSIVEGSSQLASAAPSESSPMVQTLPPPWENQDYVFLQRPGVNIRSTPAANGAVLGTAAKGTRFKITSQEGDWIQVESTRVKGWINSQFLAANKPR
jgi:hypothetical protein